MRGIINKLIGIIIYTLLFVFFILGLYFSSIKTIHSLFPLIAAAGNLFLAVFVYCKNNKSIINVTFALLSLSFGLFSTAILGLYLAPNEIFALYWGIYFSIGFMFIPPTFLHFTLSITHNSDILKNKILKIIYTISAIFTVTLYLRIMVNEYIKTGWKYSPKITFIYMIFLGFVILVALYSLMELFRKYKTTTSKIEKNQLRYVFLAGLIAVTIGALNIFLSLGMKVYPFGSLGYVAFSGIIAYAIVKHQLMDIRVIIKQSIVYATLTLFITVFYAILVAVFHGILGISLHGSASWILNAFAALIIAATFQPLRTNIQFMVDRLFFRDKYNYKTTLMDFSNALSSEIELNRLLNMILEKVTSTMHIDRGAIMLLDKNKDEYIVGVSGNIDRSSLGDFSFDKSSDLYKWLNSGRRIFNIEEERFYFKQSGLPANEKDIAAFEKILNIFEKHGIQLAVPLFVRDKLTGVFDLGRKMNEDSYSQEDLEFLTTVANQSAIAIENASLYSDIRQLEKSLYHSDKLASLGALSASMVHEIRTPITSIKSFCQMIPRMYNNPGFCNKYEVTVNRELDRLNEILERLLNFSKPIGDNDRTDKIVNIINEILLLLDKEIEKNRVKVIIEYGTSTADVMLPSDGLKQVLMNIIMNAVHAMPDGGKIRIGLEREGFEGNGSKLLKLEIEDTGIGIPKENIDKIFNAFFTTKEKGTGLGMSVSKKIINELNGNIGVASEVGKGTVFTIRLPIKTPGKLGSGLDM